MDQSAILNITAKSLILVLYLSLPPILVATLVGVLVSLIQALTQVQEQTLSFAVKLIVVIMVCKQRVKGRRCCGLRHGDGSGVR